MVSMIENALQERQYIAAWLCLCPLLAVAGTWQVTIALAICLLATIVLTALLLAAAHPFVSRTLQLPLSALLAGTLAVLEQLALAAWWPGLDAATAPWLVLVAGLTVLVCCIDEGLPENRTLTPAPLPMGEGFSPENSRNDFMRRIEYGLGLSAALLVIGVARDGFGRVFLLADTPVGALVLLALLLAALNFVGGAGSSPQTATSSPLDPGPRRNDAKRLRAAGLGRDDEQPRSALGLRRNETS